jgi:hypothetical protein
MVSGATSSIHKDTFLDEGPISTPNKLISFTGGSTKQGYSFASSAGGKNAVTSIPATKNMMTLKNLIKNQLKEQ